MTNTTNNSNQQLTTTLTFSSSSNLPLSSKTRVPLVSVVIPVYNGAKHIKMAIDSILKQTYSNYEIIVVDDGSTDDTRQQLQHYKGKIRYVFQENRGSAAARNIGIDLAKGDLVAFLDADDFWTMPNKLEKQINMFESNSSFGGINTGWVITDSEGKQIKTVQPWHQAPILDLETWLNQKCVRTSAMVFRKEWLDKVGGFDEELRQFQDVDLALRLSLAGCKIVWLKETTTCYRQSDNGTIESSLSQAKCMQTVLDKFFARQDLPKSISVQESQIRYHTLVWIAWHQCRLGNLDEMKNFLQQSFSLSPYTRVENISRWLSSFEGFSENRGFKLDADNLTSSRQWRNLITTVLELPELTDNGCELGNFANNRNKSIKHDRNAEQSLLSLPQINDEQKIDDESSTISSATAKKYQITGDALLCQGCTREALKCYQAAVEINPELIEIHYKLAVFLLEQGDLDGAITSCESVLQANPQDYETREKLADALFQRGNQNDLSRAVEYYEQAIINKPDDLKSYFKILQLKPRKLEIYLYLGKALLDKKEFVHATVLLQIASQIFPQRQEVSLLLEQALTQQQNTTVNLHDLLKVKSDLVNDLDLTSAMSFFTTGETLKKEKKIDEAAICLKKAVALQPDFYKFHHELGSIYREQKQFELAVEEAKITIELKPNFVWAHHNMGRAFAHLGFTDKAIESYQQALAINPNLTASQDALKKLASQEIGEEVKKYQVLAKEKMKAGDLEAAKVIYGKAISLRPDRYDLHHFLGDVLRRQGDLEGAIAKAKQSIELKPDFYWGYHNLGRALELKDLNDLAIESYYSALKIKPDLTESKERIEYLTANK